MTDAVQDSAIPSEPDVRKARVLSLVVVGMLLAYAASRVLVLALGASAGGGLGAALDGDMPAVAAGLLSLGAYLALMLWLGHTYALAKGLRRDQLRASPTAVMISLWVPLLGGVLALFWLSGIARVVEPGRARGHAWGAAFAVGFLAVGAGTLLGNAVAETAAIAWALVAIGTVVHFRDALAARAAALRAQAYEASGVAPRP